MYSHDMHYVDTLQLCGLLIMVQVENPYTYKYTCGKKNRKKIFENSELFSFNHKMQDLLL